MKREEDIGSLVNFTFRVSLVIQLLRTLIIVMIMLLWEYHPYFILQITNLWSSLVPPRSASLHIQWPKNNKDGKWLLYLVKVTSHGPENIICSPDSEIHSLKKVWVGVSVNLMLKNNLQIFLQILPALFYLDLT